MDWALQVIRATRSDPPGKAGEGRRRAPYGAALQQFDELIEASRTAGHASRPLPLFYALSQAGRSIVAAHGSSKGFGSHGLSEDRRIQSPDVLERAIARRPSDDDALTAACEALRIPGPFGSPRRKCRSISIGAVWAALPGFHVYLPDWKDDWFPALRAFNRGGDGRDHMDRRVMELRGSDRSTLVADGLMAGSGYAGASSSRKEESGRAERACSAISGCVVKRTIWRLLLSAARSFNATSSLG